jgi:hypothetical protein
MSSVITKKDYMCNYREESFKVLILLSTNTSTKKLYRDGSNLFCTCVFQNRQC